MSFRNVPLRNQQGAKKPRTPRRLSSMVVTDSNDCVQVDDADILQSALARPTGATSLQEMLMNDPEYQQRLRPPPRKGRSMNTGDDDHDSTAPLSTSSTSRPVPPPRRRHSLWMIPHEVLVDTFNFLDIRSVCTVMRVARRFSALGESPVLWSQIAIRLKIAVPMHHSAYVIVKERIVQGKQQLYHDLAVAEAALETTNRRLDERLQQVPAFAETLTTEHEEAVPRLPPIVEACEQQLADLTAKVDSFNTVQGALGRTLRENRSLLERYSSDLSKMSEDVAQCTKAESLEFRLRRFEMKVVRAIADSTAELPIVLRRGVSTFFELELLVLQIEGATSSTSSVSRRWNAFKKKFPLDEAWTSLKLHAGSGGAPLSGAAAGPNTASRLESKMMDRRQALLAIVDHISLLSGAQLLDYIDR